MSTFKQSLLLFKIIYKDSFSKNFKEKDEKKRKKIAVAVAIGFGAIFLMAYVCVYAYVIASGAFSAGRGLDAVQFFAGMSQFVVLFFGLFSVLSILYYSKDNVLLASLPLNTKSVFIAKFGMAYLTELLLSLLFTIPCITVCGVVGISYGQPIGAGFFIIMVIGAFILPIIPLLLVNILSLPVMYVVSLLKKRAVASTIATVLLIGCGLALYFYLIFGMTSLTEETFLEEGTVLAPSIAKMLSVVAKITVFNLPLVNAMMNVNPAANFFIYLGGVIAVGGLTVMMSSFFYRKGMSIVLEGGGQAISRKKHKEDTFSASTLGKALLVKEMKTLLGTPVMLVSSLMEIVLCPVIVLFLSNGMMDDAALTTGSNALFIIGYAMFLSIGMSVGANQVSMVGFSREGRNLYLLKSLPLSAKSLVSAKLKLSTIIGSVTIVVTAVVISVIIKNVFSFFVFLAVCIPCTFGGCCMGLYFDVKNPNLNWKNPSELNKNNKRALKPTLLTFGIALVFMVVCAVLGAVGMSLDTALLILLGVGIVVNSLMVVLPYKALLDGAEALYEKIE